VYQVTGLNLTSSSLTLFITHGTYFEGLVLNQLLSILKLELKKISISTTQRGTASSALESLLTHLKGSFSTRLYVNEKGFAIYSVHSFLERDPSATMESLI